MCISGSLRHAGNDYQLDQLSRLCGEFAMMDRVTLALPSKGAIADPTS